MPNRDQPDVFRYQNYRAFLRDHYAARKASEYGFSYRRFARSVGLGSPNYLKLVAEGARNLTAEMAGRFAAACELEGEAASYFCDLVAFNQAGASADRERCEQRLLGYKRYATVFKLQEAHAAYHAHWYVPAVRELAQCAGFVDDPKWIARRLRPRISAREAARALKTLKELGMLQEREGRLVQNEPLVSTGEGPLGHHITRYHHTMIDRAHHALDHVPTDERGFGALTIAIDASRMAELKQRLYLVRQQLLQELSAPGGERDLVVQLNIQLFPLTTVGARDED